MRSQLVVERGALNANGTSLTTTRFPQRLVENQNYPIDYEAEVGGVEVGGAAEGEEGEATMGEDGVGDGAAPPTAAVQVEDSAKARTATVDAQRASTSAPKPLPEVQSHTALTKACFDGNPEAAALMLQLGAAVNHPTADGTTAFVGLCAGASRFNTRPGIAPFLALAELLLQHGGDHTSCDGELLCMAVQHREYPLLRRLLALGDREQVGARAVYHGLTDLRNKRGPLPSSLPPP